MKQISHLLLSLTISTLFQPPLHHHAVVVNAANSPADGGGGVSSSSSSSGGVSTSGGGGGVVQVNDPQTIAALESAAKTAEALRARLQSHVEAQVNKLLAEKQLQGVFGSGNGGSGGSGSSSSSSSQGGSSSGSGELLGSSTVQITTGNVILGNTNNNIGNEQQITKQQQQHVQKLELKIDLPPDLAALVNNANNLESSSSSSSNSGGASNSASAAALKIHQLGHQLGRLTRQELYENGVVNAAGINMNININTGAGRAGGAGSGDKNDNDNSAASVETSIEEVSITINDHTTDNIPSFPSDDLLCPWGTYSESGYRTTFNDNDDNDNNDDDDDILLDSYMVVGECTPCPEGQTTMSLGSTNCVTLTEEDLLGMFYDLMNGDKWNEQHRRGWKSDTLSKCEWEGVSCTSSGEVSGIAFPIIGLNSEVQSDSWNVVY